MCIVANESKGCQKYGRHIGAKEKTPRKRNAKEQIVGTLEETINGSTGEIIPLNESTPKEARTTKQATTSLSKSPNYEPPEKKSTEELFSKVEKVPENNEILIHYSSIGEVWDRNQIVVDNIFSYKVALDNIRNNSENITRNNGVEMMMIINHKPSKNVDVEIIS